MSYFSDAPFEVLYLVLNNVDQQSGLYECALVNKSFYAAANPLLWREPKASSLSTNRKGDISFCLLQSFRQARKHGLRATVLGHLIRKLTFKYGDRLQDMRSVINNVPLVEELVIGIETLKDKDIQRIASKCPQLKRLSFDSLTNISSNFFDLLQHCPNLRELSILGTLHSNHQLTSLKHRRLEKLTLRPFDSTVYTFFSAMPTLTHLDMESWTGAYFEHYQTLPSLTLFPVLTDLHITIYYGDVPVNALVSFFKAHPLIRTLSLNLKKIDPVIMTSLATDLAHLKRLDLTSRGQLPPFTKSLPLVEKLTLRRCNMNTDFMVGMAMHFPNLHYIHIDESTKRHSSGGISQSKRDTIEALTQLKYLDFAFYDTVPDKLKVYLPRRRFWPDLLMDDLRHIRETALGLVWIVS